MLATHPVRYRALIHAEPLGGLHLAAKKLDEIGVGSFHCSASYADSHSLGYAHSPLQGYEVTHNTLRMELKDRLRSARRDANLSQEQLADRSGVDQTTISKLENGKHAGSGHIAKIAHALNVDPYWLATGKGSSHGTRDGGAGYDIDRNVTAAPALPGMSPEISWVRAGQWSEAADVDCDPDSCIWHPRPTGASDQTFVLRVVGDSMLPDYPPGRLIFVDPERAPMNNDDVIAVLTDTNEATFKRLVEEPGNGRLLKALNPAWHNPYLPINGNCHIIGVVVADMRLR